MSRSHLLFISVLLGSLLLTLASCSDDDPQTDGDTVLNYDGANATAPILASGFYEFAARFTNRELSPHVGKTITEVSFYLYEIPDLLTLTLSPDNTIDEPAEILYSEDIRNATRNSWNTVVLQTPFPIDGTPLWIGIQVELAEAIQTVGCDAGPANSNGDWLYSNNPPTWSTYRARTTTESVNWNIRATISE